MCVYGLLTLAALPVHAIYMCVHIFLILFFGSACLIRFWVRFLVLFFLFLAYTFLISISCGRATSKERTVLHNTRRECVSFTSNARCLNRCCAVHAVRIPYRCIYVMVCERASRCVLTLISLSLSLSQCDGPIIWTTITALANINYNNNNKMQFFLLVSIILFF